MNDENPYRAPQAELAPGGDELLFVCALPFMILAILIVLIFVAPLVLLHGYWRGYIKTWRDVFS